MGSSSLITNFDGEVVQHIEYVPFGEVFIEERNNTWNTPYLFNAKELDEETGLYYYGARYYDPRVSLWLSTDPLQEKYPNISSYAYCALNPVKYVDIDGLDFGIPPILSPGISIYANYTQPRSAETVKRMENGESFGNAWWNTYKNDLKLVARYGTPVEDIYAVFAGKDFDGSEYNRGEAAAWAAVGFIPFAKVTKGLKLIAVTFKYSDDVSKIVKTTGKVSHSAKEIITVTKSGTRSDAVKVLKDILGDVGENAKDYIGKFDYQKGKITGKTWDNKGFRIDYDPEKGAHFNWWNGKQKGAIQFDASENQVRQIIENELMKP